MTAPAGSGSPAPAHPSLFSALPPHSPPAPVLASPSLSAFPPGLLPVHADSYDAGQGSPDHDGDSPLLSGWSWSNENVPYGCCWLETTLGLGDPRSEAALVPTALALPPLEPSVAAMGLRGPALPVAAPAPSPEGVGAEAEQVLVPVNAAPANAAGEAAPIEPQGVPVNHHTEEVPLPPAGHPLTGLLPLDGAALRRAADAFFARLTDLAREPIVGQPAARVVPWLGVLTLVAYEWARTRKSPPCAPGCAGGWGDGAAPLPEEQG